MSPKGYSRGQIALHWLAAGVIAAQFLLEDGISAAWRAVEGGEAFAFDPLILAHVVGGVAVLLMAAWRLALRFGRGVPDLPVGDPPLQRLVANLTHIGLYALMVVLPITGGVAWFGGIEAMAEVHEVLTTLLLVLVGLHVAAALYHQIWLKDGLLMRMKRPLD
ncbi:cytochrome b561 [Gemmobacter aquatilis]|uniref:Cytochrome b561 n=1 Tax=Gemmobacter aquatilis TaxID=933059 RepID=A0A1H8I0L3_9RHOB|nr:cytochrome b/b6 domain-containing protein [Gemmobacter aquatilis]SEN61857.1 cytochrome b561 [Gemmobacter aquatilis]